MYEVLSRKSLHWINSNLKTFLNVVKVSRNAGCLWKPSAELFFVSLFKSCDDSLVLNMSKYLKSIKSSEKNFEVVSPDDFGSIVFMIFLDVSCHFSKDALNFVKLLPYREQLEFSLYYSLLNKSKSLLLLDDKILESSLIHQKLSIANFDTMDIYQLTHEIMYLTMLGRIKHPLLVNSLEYLENTFCGLLKRVIHEKNIDLIAELILVSQLLNIELNVEQHEHAYVLLDTFLNDNMKKFSIQFIFANHFYKVYHQMLVISLLR